MRDNVRKIIEARPVNAAPVYMRIKAEQSELFYLINNRGHLFFRKRCAADSQA